MRTLDGVPPVTKAHLVSFHDPATARGGRKRSGPENRWGSLTARGGDPLPRENQAVPAHAVSPGMPAFADPRLTRSIWARLRGKSLVISQAAPAAMTGLGRVQIPTGV